MENTTVPMLSHNNEVIVDHLSNNYDIMGIFHIYRLFIFIKVGFHLFLYP